jgi:hypothetical protein
MALTVAPLTAAVMSAAPPDKVGTGSAVNNAVARAAGLIAVAALPALAGLTEESYLRPVEFSDGFQIAMLIAGGLCALGGVIAAITIPGRLRVRIKRAQPEYSCALDAPPPCLVKDQPADARLAARDGVTVRQGRPAA